MKENLNEKKDKTAQKKPCFLSFLKNRKTIFEKQNKILDEYSFLPAALEITKRPPHPLNRWMLYIILGLVVFFISWSVLFHTDIVTVADGKIIPASQVKLIQSPEKGVVTKIFVVNGQSVRKNEPLIRK